MLGYIDLHRLTVYTVKGCDFMEYEYKDGIIKLPNKELTILDRLVLDFVSRIDVQYVIVSGYVAILFARSRSTEDVDLFIRDEGLAAFTTFYEKITSDGKYYAINAEDARDAYDLMSVDKSSLRFAEKGTYDPNFEVKFAKKDTDFYSLENAWSVELGNEDKIIISPMEIEIAYKLYLGSDKDFDDAAHLYVIFKGVLDLRKLRKFIKDLGIRKSVVKRVLDEDA